MTGPASEKVEELDAIMEWCEKMANLAKPGSREAFAIVADHCKRRLAAIKTGEQAT